MHVTQDCLEPGILITILQEKILKRSYAKGSHISHTVNPIIFVFLRSLSHWEKYTKLTYFDKKKGLLSCENMPSYRFFVR